MNTKSKEHLYVCMSTVVAVTVTETGETFPTVKPAAVQSFFLGGNGLVIFRQPSA